MNLNFNRHASISGLIEHVILVILLAFVAGLFVHTNMLWRWDNLLYDAQLSFWSRTVSDDIIIIAIDDESLDKIGRWPWPRSIHAQLINQLESESPRVIGLDVIFSEADVNNPQSDHLLAAAMKASARVVLPVFMTRQSINSYPIEALPLPELASQAAALGHVHLAISADGIARKVYLKEGIGKPHWYHYSLALLSVSHGVELKSDELSEHAQKQYSPMVWSREDPFLIPYAGPPGHFKQIGYSQVLAGQYPKDLFRDKIVLIGSTAEGLGDVAPTPLSAKGGSMPGIEIIANIVDSLINDLRIRQLDRNWLILITVILVALPLLIYPYLNSGSTLLVLFGIVLMTIVFAALLLSLTGLWIPLSTVLLFQFISYPLWSWRRLKLAMRHINTELDQLSSRQQALSLHSEKNIADEIDFISLFIPVLGWVIQTENDSILLQQGAVPRFNLSQLKTQGWTIDGCRYWAKINYQNKSCRLGLSVGIDTRPGDEEIRLLDSLITHTQTDDIAQPSYAEDFLQKKINQVQTVGSEYEKLRRIIDDSLSGMADGVLICNSGGQILLSNHRASWYLYGDDNARINGQSLKPVLEALILKSDGSWPSSLKKVLLKKEHVLSHAQHKSGRELMIQMSPLKLIGEINHGLVINISDISLLKASEKERNKVLDFLSHDLRSPLSSMLAMIEVSRNKKSLVEMQAMLAVMEKNTHKTLHLAEQFLQLSRANTSENIKFYEIDFNTVVLNAIDQIWPLSNKMKVNIKHQFDQDECWTYADADLLERAIHNLLSNAIKYSKAESTVNIRVYQQNNEICCCVMDQGQGIAAEELPYLFDMFRRVQGSGVERKQGIGLGLAFVDAVAKRHSGHVDVESTPGKGSSFCLKIERLSSTN